jgi:hypothetical protein
MSGLDLLVSFDATSLQTVERFAGFQGFFDMRLYEAGEASLEALNREAYSYMWSTFMNPTGPLEDSLGFEMETPYQGWMGTDSAYGRRRNWGFSGMTDALGRTYPNDPGIEYMEHSITYTAAEIIGYYKTAIDKTVLDLGGTP